MDVEVARWLVSEAAVRWLARAEAEPDPTSLAAAAKLRRELPGDRAAAVLDQVALRRRAEAAGKAGLRFWTKDGLEQATRAEVAAWRASRLAVGPSRVVDLGCGLGADAVALQAVGVDVVAVERDPVTAVLASVNLGIDVAVGDAEALATDLLGPGDAVFCDPARRTARGRTWDVADLTPPWSFVQGLLDGSRTACVKLGPGVPHRVLPDEAEVTWVSHDGDAVEATVWAGPGSQPGGRGAVILPGGSRIEAGAAAEVGPLGHWLVEPDPAVIRSGAAGTLARRYGLHAVAEGVAYLTGDTRPGLAPYGTVFEVLEALPYELKRLRAWLKAHDVGTLEIKKRGIDVDPAALRRQLRPSGSASATLVLTPTIGGARVLAVRRV